MEELDKATLRSILRHCAKERYRICREMDILFNRIDDLRGELDRLSDLKERV